jgi:hypothetical protein
MKLNFFLLFTGFILTILCLEALNNVPKTEMKTYGQQVIAKYIPAPERAEVSAQFRAFDKKWHPYSAIRIGLLPFIFGIFLILLIFKRKELLSYNNWLQILSRKYDAFDTNYTYDWRVFWLFIWMFFYISILSTGVFELFINIFWDRVGFWHIDTTSFVNTTIFPQTVWMYWAWQGILLTLINVFYFSVLKIGRK